jgi:ABC-type nitrate/sulfonate/bicarbonate transport system substrate-binding protein
MKKLASAGLAMLALLAACSRETATAPEALKEVVISYPAKAPANWPLFIAQEGGYYKKYGWNARLEFGVHPTPLAMVTADQAIMTNYTLEQAMQAASKDGSLVIAGSLLNNALFAMMAKPEFRSPADLKGKRFGVSQIGDAPYNFAVGILGKFGLTSRDVDWIPIGTEGGGRVAALAAGRIDATMVPPPAYFRLEQQGFREIANLADYDDLYAPMSYVFKKAAVEADPTLPERMIKAHAEAIKRYYDDKAFAMQAYAAYDPAQTPADIERIYDHDRGDNTYERVPYVLAPAVEYIVNHQPSEQLAAQMKAFDFHRVIDNRYVRRLVEQGFFRDLFGPEVEAEESRKAQLAF